MYLPRMLHYFLAFSFLFTECRSATGVPTDSLAAKICLARPRHREVHLQLKGRGKRNVGRCPLWRCAVMEGRRRWVSLLCACSAQACSAKYVLSATIKLKCRIIGCHSPRRLLAFVTSRSTYRMHTACLLELLFPRPLRTYLNSMRDAAFR